MRVPGIRHRYSRAAGSSAHCRFARLAVRLPKEPVRVRELPGPELPCAAEREGVAIEHVALRRIGRAAPPGGSEK